MLVMTLGNFAVVIYGDTRSLDYSSYAPTKVTVPCWARSVG